MLNCWTVHFSLMSFLLSWARTLPIDKPDSQMYPYYNPEENLDTNEFLTEGDILVQRKRSADIMYFKTWYNRSVPYFFDRSMNADRQKQVEAAMFEIQNATCIRFKRRESEKDHIQFIVSETGCYSAVGRMGGPQVVSLAEGCWVHGIIQHEILHALGLWHEHSRRDRDEYIKVVWDNINIGHKQNFCKKTSDFQEIFLTMPYDYGSVMHYANNTFAKDRHKPTLIPKTDLPRDVVMGQRVRISQGDIDKLNALYNCDIKNCSNPGLVSNGRVIGIDYSVGAKIHFSCNSGFTLIGAAERVCRDTGEWSGDMPSCLASASSQSLPLHYCNFDDHSNPFCGWSQAVDEELDWSPQTGPTDSNQTGPMLDHTLSTVYGGYVYVEASNKSPFQKARLISPAFIMKPSRACLVFFANLFGEAMGNLTVYFQRSTPEGHKQNDVLMSIVGNQGQDWKQVFLVLPSIDGLFRIVIEGSIGNGFQSDIAIDDIVLGDCSLFKPLAISGGLSETTNCSFDSGLCQFIQDKQDNIDWVFNIGKTRTINTGPDCDPHNCLTGQYLYIESSSPRVMGDRARLRTPVLGGVGRRCLSFYYHMYGDHIGSLTVKTISSISGTEQILWTASGNQGHRWHSEHIDFISLEAYEISFDGTVGPSYKGDIAIDSISVIRGRCLESLQFDCSFEHDLCGWMNAPTPGDTLDWVRHSGETDTPNTGPITDRFNPDGFYLYVESSRTSLGDLARLVSPTVSASPIGYCMTFWYHMFGQTSGNLTVSTQSDIGQEQLLWSIHGDQGNLWKRQLVNVTSSGLHSFNIIFEVTMKGSGYTGDVAIDDISLQNSFCGS